MSGIAMIVIVLATILIGRAVSEAPSVPSAVTTSVGSGGDVPADPALVPARAAMSAVKFSKELAAAQRLHYQHRTGGCTKALGAYQKLATVRPDDPDVVWGIAECGAVVAAGLSADAARQQSLREASLAAYRRYAELEKRPAFTTPQKCSKQCIALARVRASQLEAQLATGSASGPPSPPTAENGPSPAADKAARYERMSEKRSTCGNQCLWSPETGFDESFLVQLFALLYEESGLQIIITLDPDRHDNLRTRQLPRVYERVTTSADVRRQQRFEPMAMPPLEALLKRITFIGGQVNKPARVSLRIGEMETKAVEECGALRGSLVWAQSEAIRRAGEKPVSVVASGAPVASLGLRAHTEKPLDPRHAAEQSPAAPAASSALPTVESRGSPAATMAVAPHASSGLSGFSPRKLALESPRGLTPGSPDINAAIAAALSKPRDDTAGTGESVASAPSPAAVAPAVPVAAASAGDSPIATEMEDAAWMEDTTAAPSAPAREAAASLPQRAPSAPSTLEEQIQCLLNRGLARARLVPEGDGWVMRIELPPPGTSCP